MSFDGEEKQWSCGKAGAVNLQIVSSIVRDIGEPCLHQSPTKGTKMLKPDKWKAAFDDDGRVIATILSPDDKSTGCALPMITYTAEYRRQLRVARRERYVDLVKQCQTMHSSIGTGSLAYVVGSKVMDARTLSKDISQSEAEPIMRLTSHDASDIIEDYCNLNTNSIDTSSHACQIESSSDSADHTSVRESTDSGTYDFPALPVTDLFEMSDTDNNTEESRLHNYRLSRDREPGFRDRNMHSFQINNNVDLIIESNGSPSNDVLGSSNSVSQVLDEPVIESGIERKARISRLRISDIPQTSANATSSQALSTSEERVSEWLWTLHRIVVDVVRTDSHLEFYEETKNVARMSDILAVYAWIDPATGYCQGMSDLLSPFVVLYEDDADAFWCFEMLLRRMRENFQMDGPTGVMRQLQALWHILKVTDREMFSHLSIIGAENLHFAFRMLLVLFRRELPFNEALRMWEMMWAADFDDLIAQELEKHCLEALILQLPRDSASEVGEEIIEIGNGISKGHPSSKNGHLERSVSDNVVIKPASSYPFCGLATSFWSRNDRMHISSAVSSRNGDDELSTFCVGAILILNRQKIIKETNSIDDLIKMFNDKILKINVRRCITTAIKLRKKYLYKLGKSDELRGEKNFRIVDTRPDLGSCLSNRKNYS
ncbi:hypothetical protein Sjap_009299 [Stephania japonica]|uniref:Rab-GAP TBC domain-containing protein n=1 Tax=Stephania japonica TaxID=461633 RepID=A0AAP0JTF3_9MAGN